ncbi:LicD family protein [Fadolivirus algeromassiliense]|uniref:LicD family protein n=1 Tax=Fadolivirus FV1/VV64 TaxID=3070911 RepID=A0A7D3QTP0_9VIRU|nr:LicD family protein [Fadolivirus algeromassiliense]QKF93465.1 LicD family protein [Fadolivirus FV1/VV64]
MILLSLIYFEFDYKDQTKPALLILLKEGHNYLKKIKVPHWIDFGTLLGSFREGKVIEYDNDVDFGFPIEYADVVLNNKHLLPKYIEFYDTSKKHGYPKFGIMHKTLGGNCDFYSYSRLQNGKLRYNLDPGYKSILDGRDIPYDFIYPLRDCKINNISVKCPNKTEQYLRHRYGYIGYNGIKDKQTGWYIPSSLKN